MLVLHQRIHRIERPSFIAVYADVKHLNGGTFADHLETDLLGRAGDVRTTGA